MPPMMIVMPPNSPRPDDYALGGTFVLFLVILGSMALALAADSFGLTPPAGFVPR
jgi:hypothetical protein